MKFSIKKALLTGSLVFGVAVTLPMVQPAPASATGTVPTDLQTAIDNSVSSVNALSPLVLACLAVALIPLGSMLTLKFIHMVLARA